ncbi:hypothetical protein [Streptomyces sp. HNM0574]|uniref:hypothetical protein n=1 Tax=Streptomyces sp. HNM0574 TaxID=2714954 RepID=UPI00146B070E|nr:hypothetical protein [Streptomyces sp. HNM0574]NLU66653.1 hypothetical protein [Streptomyces sp. HNM0574]
MSTRKPHYPVPSEERTQAMVEGVLRGSDRVVALHPVQQIDALGRTVPKRLRPQPAVFPPKPPVEPRRIPWWEYPLVAVLSVYHYVTLPFYWIGDKIADGIFWLFRTPKRRYKLKHLKGGWNSHAGGLVSKTRPADHQALVVGDRLLALVHVGPEAAELAWSVPREQLTGVEYETWARKPGVPRSVVRFHFADASWGDISANGLGPGWQQLLEHLPKH